MPMQQKMFFAAALYGVVFNIAAAAIAATPDANSPFEESAVTNGRMDLSIVRRHIIAYADSLRVPGGPFGQYYYKEGQPPNLYASCDVAIMRTIMGEDLKKTLTDAQRRQWIDYINSFAALDGTYQRVSHSFEHANGMVIGALGALGGKQKYPVRLYDAFDSPEEVGLWLENIDWQRQWAGSHLFWGGMHCYSNSSRCTEQWRQAVFEWLDANIDPNTGWWRKGFPHATPNEGLGGGAHIWPMYQHFGRPFPYPQRVIDSILQMQKPDGSWMRPGSYLDLDALYGLKYMKTLAPDYRQKDIAQAVEKHARLVIRFYPGYIDTEQPDLHRLLALVGEIGLLQQLCHKKFTDSVQWTDIFSDSRLYRTAAVEVLPEASKP